MKTTNKTKMTNADDKFYWKTAEGIRPHVYEFYNMQDRKDLVMVYELHEDKIYSYIFDDYKKDLKEHEQAMLEKDYQKALKSQKLLLFIKDPVREKMILCVV